MIENIVNCTLCPLHKDLPTGCKPIRGRGKYTADILCVTDFVTRSDVLCGEVMSGRVGKYLENMLIKTGLSFDDIYLSSLVHCWPNNKNKDRPPNKDEIGKCKPWLWEEIKLVKPKAIVTFGMLPTNTLGRPAFGKNIKLKDVVGNKYELPYTQALLFPCYHPKYVMTRSAHSEGEFMQVLQKVKDYIGEAGNPS